MNTERYLNTVLLDVGMFTTGVVATWFLGWSTKDLLWGMWISSLVSGVVFYVRGLTKNARIQTIADVIMGIVVLVFGLGFFLLHFGMFHYIQASMLDLLIPLVPDPNRVYVGHLTWKGVRGFSIVDTIVMALSSYWVLVVATVVHQFLSPPPNLNSENDNFRPYIFVLKMHFLMFILGGLYAIGLESFPVYVVVLLFFFTPSSLKLLFSKKDKAEPAGG